MKQWADVRKRYGGQRLAIQAYLDNKVDPEEALVIELAVSEGLILAESMERLREAILIAETMKLGRK